jgi:hypothetical protein
MRFFTWGLSLARKGIESELEIKLWSRGNYLGLPVWDVISFFLRDNLSKVMVLGTARSLKFVLHQTELLVDINILLVKS